MEKWLNRLHISINEKTLDLTILNEFFIILKRVFDVTVV